MGGDRTCHRMGLQLGRQGVRSQTQQVLQQSWQSCPQQQQHSTDSAAPLNGMINEDHNQQYM